MKHIRNCSQNRGPTVAFAAAAIACSLAVSIPAAAQDISDLHQRRNPLVLAGQGSFFVGGDTVKAEPGDLGPDRPAGLHEIRQMYVEYMIPVGRPGDGRTKVPVVLIHGGGLSGKSWETTPDGRIGLDEYFVRKRYPVYTVDQASRARSGFDVTLFNRVRDGRLPPTALPAMTRTSFERTWVTFRFGPEFGVPYPDEQFPVAALAEFSKQGVPSLNALLEPPDANHKALSDLAIKLKGAVLIGHSQSGHFPLEAALVDPTGIKGMVLTEPGGCMPAPFTTPYTDEQVAKLATVPILVMFLDHLNTPGQASPWDVWFEDCKVFIDRVNAAGGNAKMLHPPELGIFGNSHMWMLDKNNLQLADLVMKWIDENAGRKKDR
jgi:pimeloyl-ACP methyl ester carboxylesterase